MIIKGIWSTHKVFIGPDELSPIASQKVYNHSPDGFCWGYGGSGPAQLALALLMRYLPTNSAVNAYQDFKFAIIAQLPQADFEIDESIVIDWIKEHNL